LPEAISKNKHVMALMRDNQTWEPAIVRDVRVKPALESDEPGSAMTPSTAGTYFDESFDEEEKVQDARSQ
jgi:hypothetical protein